jgi:transcriptional regulator GlxA family with amidase domain
MSATQQPPSDVAVTADALTAPPPPPPRKPTIFFIVYDTAEVLDFSGTFDVFSMAMVAVNRPLFDLRLVSPDGGPITAVHGFKVVADAALADAAPCKSDVVVVPGCLSIVTDALAATHTPPRKGSGGSRPPPSEKQISDCRRIVEFLRGPAQGAGIVSCICTGAFFAAEAGLFDHRALRVTTHGMAIRRLQEWLDTNTTEASAGGAGGAGGGGGNGVAQVVSGARYLMNPTPASAGAPLVMTSAGVSAGMDLAFAMLRLLLGAEVAELTRVEMEYNCTSNFTDTPPLELPGPLQYYRALQQQQQPASSDGGSAGGGSGGGGGGTAAAVASAHRR